MFGGGSDTKKQEASNRLGLPVELIEEAEGFREVDGLVYPDNWQSVSVFCDLMTQWRTGMNGPTGLDYGALPAVFNIRRMKRADREAIFDDVRIMERAALDQIRKNRE